MTETKKVYAAINKIQLALSKTGIAKDRVNTQGQSYKFRGIDDVYNALSPLLAEHGLCILPRMLGRVCEERQSNAGKPLFYVTVDAEFDLVCAEDGSIHTVKTYGEAMDSGDKATNKAMSAAYKYAAFQAFAIPTEGDNDADAQTHQLASQQEQYEAFCNTHRASIDAIKEGIRINLDSADAEVGSRALSSAAEAWFELSEDVKIGLWKAPTKGGCFTTQERTVIKSTEFRQAHFGVN